MSLRKWLLGLTGAIAASASVAAAEPPINPLVEGREPDPVARQFHEPERQLGGYVAYPASSANSTVWTTATIMLWELLLDQMTFQLGTAIPAGDQYGA